MPLEFDLIERHFTGADAGEGVVFGIGDDAAVVSPPPGQQLVTSVDTLAAGTHLPEDAPAQDFGFRSLAVNLSDLAAMGARPLWALLALTLPEVDEAWVAGFAQGFRSLAAESGVALIGGNISRGPLAATVTVTGSVAPGEWLARAGGRPGQRILLSGAPGDAAGGLAAWRNGQRDPAHSPLLRRYLRPRPRVALGRAAVGLASAAIDVSDGLLADLGHLCRASGCAARLDLERLPLSPELRAACGEDGARALALFGGDDYELLLTAEPAAAAVLHERAAALTTPLTDVGELTAGAGVATTLHGRPVTVGGQGFTHFDAGA